MSKLPVKILKYLGIENQLWYDKSGWQIKSLLKWNKKSKQLYYWIKTRA